MCFWMTPLVCTPLIKKGFCGYHSSQNLHTHQIIFFNIHGVRSKAGFLEVRKVGQNRSRVGQYKLCSIFDSLQTCRRPAF